MFKVLLKKQMQEVFRRYFYDSKKNKPRSKGAVIGMFALFALLMVGVLGGSFGVLAYFLCDAMSPIGFGWFYFLIMTLMALVLGAFGSIFNTYTGLYLAKDNDLLLSMPIPVKYIMASRLLNVYLMGAMYAGIVLVPTIVIYWVIAGFTLTHLIGGVVLFLVITLLIFIISCLLGWVVAKVSTRLKNKSFATVFIALICIAAYYFLYFRASDLIGEIVKNAAVYGSKIKGAAYWVYMFGRIGEGDWRGILLFSAIVVFLLIVIWKVLVGSFLGIAGKSGVVSEVKYKAKKAKQRSVFAALLHKEFLKFSSSPSYMLNCGMGIIMIPAIGVFLLVKGNAILTVVDSMMGSKPGIAALLLCAILCMAGCMNLMAAPAVSLEGKSIWIPQSMPIEQRLMIRAKFMMQLILSVIPMAFAVICGAIVSPGGMAEKVMIVLLPLVFTVFMSALDTFCGWKFANLNWTNEIVPIKQGMAVLIALLGGWAICVAVGAGYFFIGYKLGFLLYSGILLAVFAALTAILIAKNET